MQAVARTGVWTGSFQEPRSGALMRPRQTAQLTSIAAVEALMKSVTVVARSRKESGQLIITSARV